jgi:hypothetical protein
MRIADPPNYGNMTRQFLRPARRLVTLGLRDAPKRDFVAAGWRTAEFHEIAIGSQCWLGAVRKDLDGLSRRTPSYPWCQPDQPGQLGWVANCGSPAAPSYGVGRWARRYRNAAIAIRDTGSAGL